MNKRILSAAAAGMIFLTCLPQAFAQILNVDICEINPDTRIVTVSGTVTEARHLQKVTLRVTADEDNSLNYINQATVKTDGSFLLQYKMTGNSGMYTFHMNTEGAEGDFTKQIDFVDPEVINNIIKGINETSSGAELFSYISAEEVQKNLDLKIDELEKIGSVEEACKLIANNKPVFNTATEFINTLKIKTVVAGINAAESAESIMNFIDGYHTRLGLDGLKRYEKYCAKNEDGSNTKISVGTADRLAALTFRDEKDFSERFEEQFVLEQIEQVAGYGEVYEILEDNNDILGLNFTKYNKLKSKSAVTQAIAGGNYLSAEELEKAFDSACSAQYNKENSSQGTGGSGGSAGGSGSGGSPGFVGKTEPTVEKDKEEQPEVKKEYFSDLGNYAWAEEGINYLYEKGVVSGDGAGKFNPADSVTREQFIKMLAVMFDFETGKGNTDFCDVDNDAWYAEYVYAAVNSGIVSGYPDGSFGIGKNISRQDIAVIITRALKWAEKELTARNEKKEFADDGSISEYARESVAYMQTAGIINGFEDGTFAPEKGASRAEAARILFLIYNEIN